MADALTGAQTDSGAEMTTDFLGRPLPISFKSQPALPQVGGGPASLAATASPSVAGSGVLAPPTSFGDVAQSANQGAPQDVGGGSPGEGPGGGSPSGNLSPMGDIGLSGLVSLGFGPGGPFGGFGFGGPTFGQPSTPNINVGVGPTGNVGANVNATGSKTENSIMNSVINSVLSQQGIQHGVNLMSMMSPVVSQLVNQVLGPVGTLLSVINTINEVAGKVPGTVQQGLLSIANDLQSATPGVKESAQQAIATAQGLMSGQLDQSQLGLLSQQEVNQINAAMSAMGFQGYASSASPLGYTGAAPGSFEGPSGKGFGTGGSVGPTIGARGNTLSEALADMFSGGIFGGRSGGVQAPTPDPTLELDVSGNVPSPNTATGTGGAAPAGAPAAGEDSGGGDAGTGPF